MSKLPLLQSLSVLVLLSCGSSDKGLTIHNTAPVVTFKAPVEGSPFQVSEVVHFEAMVQDKESEPDALELAWSSDLDGLLEEGSSASSDGLATFSTAGLSEGLHTVTLKATDLKGEIGSDYMTVKIETDCLALTGCDYDEDGYTEEQGDCDDNDDGRHPDADEIENGIDDDCDGIVDEGTQRYDDDGDGYTELEGDCNDDNDGISPVADEIADGVDQDCDDLIDEGTDDYDDDGDGYTELEGDCNDDNSAIHPEAEEVANGVDDDCDGVIDEGSDGYDDDGDGYTELAGDCDDDDPLVSPVGIEVCGDEVDNDCDSYVDAEDDDTDEDGDGFSSCEGEGQDCDDDDEDIHPDAAEVCDEVDNDCDGDVDAEDDETDADEDGHSVCSGDCDDSRDDVYPGSVEVCDPAGLVDEDCDGTINEDGASGSTIFYLDGDGDGFGGSTTREACSLPDGYTTTSTDCDDSSADVGDGLTWYYDGDGDGYGSTPEVACLAPSSSYVLIDDDCDDADITSHPGATEVCDGADNDCDEVIDESGAVGEKTWYYDGDSDDFPDADISVTSCTGSSGFLEAGTFAFFDCDDTNPSINPAAVERCDDVDWDCSAEEFYPASYTLREEYAIGAIGCMEYHRDEDWDGYGVIDDYLCLCDESGEYRIPAGEVTLETDDCCDTEWGAKPGSDSWRSSATDCGHHDWNCDDEIEGRWTDYGMCGGPPVCEAFPHSEGWLGSIPSCGYSGEWLDGCDEVCAGFLCLDSYCEKESDLKEQNCR